MRDIEVERDEILQDYKQAIQDNEGGKGVKESQLNSLNQKLLAKNNQIGSLQVEYDIIYFTCDEIKARMAHRVGSIDKIADCLGKKHYYDELILQSKKYLTPEREPTMI